MPSAAKKLAIVHNDEPAPEMAQQPSQDSSQEPAQDVSQQPVARAEELRLLEALLFAAGSPLDEATLKRQLPDGVDVKAALASLQA